MNRFPYRLSPSADREVRRARLEEIRRLIQSGQYHIPAERIAEALLADVWLGNLDSSSWRGQDADAN
jgi:hypothetical protein